MINFARICRLDNPFLLLEIWKPPRIYCQILQILDCSKTQGQPHGKFELWATTSTRRERETIDCVCQWRRMTSLHMLCSSLYSLRLVDGLGHREEGAVGQDRKHHQVVKILVHRNVDCSLPQLKFINDIYKSSNLDLHHYRVVKLWYSDCKSNSLIVL